MCSSCDIVVKYHNCHTVLEACMAAVLVGIIRLDSWAALSMAPDAWSVSCACWRSFVFILGVSCLLCSLAVPAVSKFLRVTQKTGNAYNPHLWCVVFSSTHGVSTMPCTDCM